MIGVSTSQRSRVDTFAFTKAVILQVEAGHSAGILGDACRSNAQLHCNGSQGSVSWPLR